MLHPETLKLSKDEESNICFLAFPDSHSNCNVVLCFLSARGPHVADEIPTSPFLHLATGDSVFSFRFGRSLGSNGAVSESVESVHLNGFVFNRVQRDASQRRGYLQKSVVIISERSDVLLWPLFHHMIGVIGREYFKCVPSLGSEKADVTAGASFLHSVYHEVRRVVLLFIYFLFFVLPLIFHLDLFVGTSHCRCHSRIAIYGVSD